MKKTILLLCSINLAENGACKLLEGARMIFYGGRIE